MNIYVGHSKLLDYHNELYKPIRSSDICQRHRIILPHETSGEPFDSKTFLKECDLFIVEDSFPATGLGIELGWANLLGVPIFVILRDEAKGTGSLTVISEDIQRYSSVEEMVRLIEAKIKEVEALIEKSSVKEEEIQIDYAVFFTYESKGESLKSMAVVKADSTEEAGKKLRDSADKEAYKGLHVWWIEELSKMYNGKDVIIP